MMLIITSTGNKLFRVINIDVLKQVLLTRTWPSRPRPRPRTWPSRPRPRT